MRKFQVTLNINRVDDLMEKDAVREEITIYADANNLYEALYAAMYQVEQYVPKEHSGVAIDSKPTSVFPGREAE